MYFAFFQVSMFCQERERRDDGLLCCDGADHVPHLLQSQKHQKRRLCKPGMTF